MAQVRNRKRKVSKQQQAVYRRRRIVVGVALVLIVALVVFCVYSIGRGISEVGQSMDARAASHVDISRQATPQPHRSTGIKNCDSSSCPRKHPKSLLAVLLNGRRRLRMMAANPA